MRRVLVLTLAVAGGAGCGTSDRPDNSAIQTPAAEPIGPPQPAGGARAAELGNGKGGKPPPRIEIKQ